MSQIPTMKGIIFMLCLTILLGATHVISATCEYGGNCTTYAECPVGCGPLVVCYSGKCERRRVFPPFGIFC
ncbi:hypothetical protein GE061_009103 [Apolygus lucorum]|uniref:Uncharacterized protein n=1 Tax=Apolygus lucorum TaxID=248454 RepID=A0A6A4KBM9_APOLU|nr:hypothetical protein GE061_009103 [Apolygus lucorum]